ncbi:MAG: HgcAB-like fusion protein [Gemmatimonadota bacterium]
MTLPYPITLSLQTLLRVLPFPVRTGLVVIGSPGRDAPVLLTGNFGLTVARVRRALRGVDAYLLVADSRGVNVWCAAAGGHLTEHDVVTALKTTGIEERVGHRRLILPQLAATGIEAREVHRRTGWRVAWGPVRASALPAYLSAGGAKTGEMRTVDFPWRDRLEMAMAWAFPMSVLALVLWPVWPAGVLPAVGLVWAVSLALFLAFPIYASRLRSGQVSVGFVFFDFGRRGLPLLVWALLLGVLAVGALGVGAWDLRAATRWAALSLVVLLLFGLDLEGSTPVRKSGLHPERRLRIHLDEDRCRGAGFCADVCPVDVFEIDASRRLARLPRAGSCVQCGACIVQCPFDALSLEGPAGLRVGPETIRRFKLNLLGRRAERPGAREG